MNRTPSSPYTQRLPESNNNIKPSQLDSRRIQSSRTFHSSYSAQNINLKQKEKSIQQFLHSQNDLKIRSFKQSMQMLPNLESIEFEDNSIYYGQVIDNGIQHGIGIFQTAEGDIYLGDWENDRYHGYGLYIYSQGQRYEGELVEGVKEGQGKYFYKDGRVYQGEWKDDEREGEGVQKDPLKGMLYQGQWSSDQKNGYGKLFYLDFNSVDYQLQQVLLMEGIWSNNVFTTGMIISEVYQGEIRNQALSGQGTYKFPDGSVYHGQFNNNLLHGHGSYYYPNGDVYEGGFAHGLKSGLGVYKYFTGDVYEGGYEKDLKSGEGKFMFVNGSYYVGEFQRDSFHGKGKYFFTQQEAIAGWWENGQLSKNTRIEDIGANRNKALFKQKQSQIHNRTPNKNMRSPSPIRYPSSLTQLQPPRSVSPFSQYRQMSTIERQEKASVISINPGRSPIKNSKFMEAHTPTNTYQKSSPYIFTPVQSHNLSNTLLNSKERSSLIQSNSHHDNNNNFVHQPNQNNRNKADNYESQRNFVNIVDRRQQVDRVENEVVTLERRELQNDNNKGFNSLFQMMSNQRQGNQTLINPTTSIPKNQQKESTSQQVPKKSKRKLQYR